MSADVNFYCVSGRLTKDVEIKPINQSFLVTGSIACNRSVKKDGQWQEVASFFNFKSWIKSEKQVEFYRTSFIKGSKVLLNGDFETDTYEKDGQKRTAFTLNAIKIEPMGASRGGASSEAGFPEDSGFPD